MNILRFPKTITLELTDLQRALLDALIERRPQFADDQALLGHVVVEGIFATLDEREPVEGFEPAPTMAERMKARLEETADDVAEPPEVRTAATLPPFPKITRRYMDPRRQHVETYVATVIPKGVQDRLQIFLDRNPEADLESLLATLIGVGLDQVEEDPKILKPDPAEEFAKMKGSSPPPVMASADGEAFTLDFPRTVRLDLDDKLRDALRDLANVQEHSSDEDLVRGVLARGLEAMRNDGVLQPLATSAGVKRARHKEHGMDVSLEDRLRKKLIRFLADHPDAMKREHARKLLADLGSGRG